MNENKRKSGQRGKQINKKVWHTCCATCGKQIVNNGSSRGKKYCDIKCRDKHPTVRARQRAYSKKRYWATNTKPARIYRRETNKQILIEEKLRRGECALHPDYNNGERKYVVPSLEYLFDMDHIDRNAKHETIAKMMFAPEKRFRQELAKCQMVCVECHRRKTVENKDWVAIVKVLEPEMRVVYNQPTLFDN